MKVLSTKEKLRVIDMWSEYDIIEGIHPDYNGRNLFYGRFTLYTATSGSQVISSTICHDTKSGVINAIYKKILEYALFKCGVI